MFLTEQEKIGMLFLTVLLGHYNLAMLFLSEDLFKLFYSSLKHISKHLAFSGQYLLVLIFCHTHYQQCTFNQEFQWKSQFYQNFRSLQYQQINYTPFTRRLVLIHKISCGRRMNQSTKIQMISANTARPRTPVLWSTTVVLSLSPSYLLLFCYTNQKEMSRKRSDPPDSLQLQRQRFNSVQESTSVSSKAAMQQLYRQQLDSLLEEKVRLRQVERAQMEVQRRQFNVLVEQGKETEKSKEANYKNYYNQLLSQQQQKQQSYVSPFSKADSLKQALISKGIDQDRARYQHLEQDLRVKEVEKRNNYRNQLLHQIEERRAREAEARQLVVREKVSFQNNSKNPQDLQREERERKRQEIEKYREDLEIMARGRSSSDRRGSSEVVLRPEYHNILTNPMPYNIQNPYLLKEMGKNPSYLAMKGSQHLQQP